MPTLAVMGREAVAGFDPRELGKLEFDYDAWSPNGVGVALPADLSQLSPVKDLSGKGRDLIQTSAALKPRYYSPNFNLIDPTLTTYTGGATLSATTGEVTLPIGGYVDYWAKINGAAAWRCLVDWWNDTQSPNVPYQPQGGRYFSVSYFAADRVTPAQNTSGVTSNAAALACALNSWVSNQYVGTSLSGPNVIWLRLRCQAHATYCAGLVKVRAPCITTNDTPLTGKMMPPVGLNMPCFAWDGVATVAASTALLAIPTGPFTFYTVFNPVTYLGTAENILYVGSASTYTRSLISGGRFSGAYPAQSLGNLAWSYWHVGSGSNNGVDTATTTLDGAAQTTATANPGLMTGAITMGGDGATRSYFGGVAKALGYSAEHDKATRRRVINWLAQRYGLPLTRP